MLQNICLNFLKCGNYYFVGGNMKSGFWEDEEVKNLFSEVEIAKKHGKALRFAFLNHATKYSRKSDSVRNYYYHEVDELSVDSERCQRIGIDIDKHKKNEISFFTNLEEKKLIEKIDEMVKGGTSVRKACLNLSEGNIDTMIRYQNKYRNFKSKENGNKKNINNIIVFRQQKVLTDNDIKSLFMGLVRLVKKTAYEDDKDKVKIEHNNANEMLKKALLDISRRDRQIENLKDEYKKLKLENQKLNEQIIGYKCEKANLLSLNEKLNEERK